QTCALPIYGRDDLQGELGEPLGVAAEQERVDAVADGQLRQLVDPLLRRAVQEAPRTALVDRALQDVDAADLGGVAARGRRGVVEAALPVREPFRRDERRRRDPAVRGAPGEVDALRPG